MNDLENAWKWREAQSCDQDQKVLRVFHGPGEGHQAFQFFAIDRFGDHYWVTQWEAANGSDHGSKGRSKSSSLGTGPIQSILSFLQSKGAVSIVFIYRPLQGIPKECSPLWGDPPQKRFRVQENQIFFWIQHTHTRHPGLFLDHQPLRQWLTKNMDNCRVLNTFAYTGSLSVSAGKGNATHVTSLDVSSFYLAWAQENWKLNGLSEEKHRLLGGDVFDWLPRLKKRKEKFDCIILDPPSFSKTRKKTFSTTHDLEKLHCLALDVLAPGGFILTSIHSSQLSWQKLEADLCAAFKQKKTGFQVIQRMDLPPTFPTVLGRSADRYLKGFILKQVDASLA